MAMKWKVNVTRQDSLLFDPADIVIKAELNGRHHLPDIEWLKASIADIGQQQPVLIRSEADKPVLVAGFSRWRAIVELNEGRAKEDRIKIRAIYVRCNEQDSVIVNFEENERRNALTALDKAAVFARLERYGWDIPKISSRLRVSEKEVAQGLALYGAEPEIQEAVGSGALKVGAAVKIAKLAASEQRKAAKEVASGSDVTALMKPDKPKYPGLRDVCASLLDHSKSHKNDEVRKFLNSFLAWARTPMQVKL